MLNNVIILTAVILAQVRGTPPAPPVPPVPTNAVPIVVGPMLVGPDGNPVGINQTPQQPQPPGTATVDGIVTILGTNDPIPGAIVEMRKAECGRTGGESMTATSGPDGRFSFKQVRSGSWCIGAARTGGAFSPAEYRQRGYKSRGIAVPIADTQQVQDIRLMLPRTGSISGRVIDSGGEPMTHARVQAMEAFYQDGPERLHRLNVVQSNGQGELRLFWLPPGEW